MDLATGPAKPGKLTKNVSSHATPPRYTPGDGWLLGPARPQHRIQQRTEQCGHSLSCCIPAGVGVGANAAGCWQVEVIETPMGVATDGGVFANYKRRRSGAQWVRGHKYDPRALVYQRQACSTQDLQQRFARRSARYLIALVFFAALWFVHAA